MRSVIAIALAAMFMAASTAQPHEDWLEGDNLPICNDDIPQPSCKYDLTPSDGSVPGVDELPAESQIKDAFQTCASGASFGPLNCVELPEAFTPDHINPAPMQGSSLAKLSHAVFGDRSAVAIVDHEKQAKKYGARHPCEYGHYWWCGRYAKAPGQDEDRSPDERDHAGFDYDSWDETPEDPNPWNDGNEPDQPSINDWDHDNWQPK